MRTSIRTWLVAIIFTASHAGTFCHVRADEPQAWTFAWHSSEVTGLAFTPDDTRLLTTSLRDDRISKIVASTDSDSSIGASVGKMTGARSHAVAVNSDGTMVAIAGFRVTSVYDFPTLEELWQMNTAAVEYSPPFVMALAFSPDNRWLATSGSSSKVGGPHGYKGGLITIRDAKSGKELHRFHNLSHSSDSIAFSPDGKLFAAGTYGAGGELPEPGELRVWDAANGKLLHVWKVKDSVEAGDEHCSMAGIAFSPDSRSIAVGSSDGVVRLWNVAAGESRVELKGHERGVRRVAFSPSGRVLASAGLDRTVRIWDTATRQQVKSFDIKAPKINALAFSADGRLLATGGGDFLRMGEVRMWQLQDSDHE